MTFSLRTMIVAGAAIMSLFSIQSLAADTSTAYSRHKNDARKQYQQGNLVAAQRSLEKAKTALNDNPKPSPLDREAVLYDLANVKLEYAYTMTNPTQKADIADKSIKYWIEYRNWFRSLDSSDRSSIEAQPNSFRIQQAMELLGIAYVSRGDLNSFSTRELFTVYADLDSTYLNSASVKRWRELLHRCPSWKPLPGGNPPLDSLQFSGANANCKELWREFSNFLERWVKEQKIVSDKLETFMQWHKDLEKSLGTP